jgi:hypothetical protein
MTKSVEKLPKARKAQRLSKELAAGQTFQPAGQFRADIGRRECLPDANDGTAGIGDLAERLLQESPYYGLRHIQCDFHEGMITLRGRVASYYLKQVAQTVVRQIQRGIVVNNLLEVAPSRWKS